MAKNLKRHYQRHYKDDIYENLKRCTVLLAIRKKQIKTRMRYYYKGRITTTTRTTNKQKTPFLPIPWTSERKEQLEISYIDGGDVQPLWENTSLAMPYHMI